MASYTSLVYAPAQGKRPECFPMQSFGPELMPEKRLASHDIRANHRGIVPLSDTQTLLLPEGHFPIVEVKRPLSIQKHCSR